LHESVKNRLVLKRTKQQGQQNC